MQFQMTVKEAQKSHELGWIKSFQVHASEGAWVVLLMSEHEYNDSIVSYLKTSRGDIKRFKKTETVLKTLQKIGFEVEHL